MEPSVSGVAVEEVTVVRPCPVVGTVVPADASFPNENMAVRAKMAARDMTNVLRSFIIAYSLLIHVKGHLIRTGSFTFTRVLFKLMTALRCG